MAQQADAIKSRPSRGLLLIVSTFLGVLFLIQNVVLSLVLAASRTMYSNIGDPLPVLTQILVSLPTIYWIKVGLIGCTIAILKDFVIPRESAITANFLLILLMVCLGILIAVGLFLPLVPDVQSM